jgi:hypothetical protein
MIIMNGPAEQGKTMRQLLKIFVISSLLIFAPGVYAADFAAGGSGIIGAQEPVPGLATSQGLSMAQGGGLTLNQAVEQVRRQYKGRIVSAETKRSGNREVHHIKVLTDDGKVKTVTVQGRSLSGGG